MVDDGRRAGRGVQEKDGAVVRAASRTGRKGITAEEEAELIAAEEEERQKRRKVSDSARVEYLIRDAMAQGKFDNLKYAGKPIPGLGHRSRLVGEGPSSSSFSKEGKQHDFSKQKKAHPVCRVPSLTILTSDRVSSMQATLPNPVLVFMGPEFVETDGKAFTRYRYAVDNFQAYPGELFAAAPNSTALWRKHQLFPNLGRHLRPER